MQQEALAYLAPNPDIARYTVYTTLTARTFKRIFI